MLLKENNHQVIANKQTQSNNFFSKHSTGTQFFDNQHFRVTLNDTYHLNIYVNQ